jgi:putative ABC transport system permease protein
MRAWSVSKIALSALRRNKLRSGLTALGVVIGVAAVIAMVSIGAGARAEVEKQVASLGQNVILVLPGSASPGSIRAGWGSANTLTVEDALAIADEIPEVVALSPGARSRRQVSYGSRNWSASLQGEGADYLQIRAWRLAEGSMFTEHDVETAAKVVVIGMTVANQLFEGQNPVGETIRLGHVPMTVVGLLEAKGTSLLGSDQDDVIFMPYTTCLRHFYWRTGLTSISVQVFSPRVMREARLKIEDLLRQRHRIGPGQEDDFTVRTQDEIAEAATAMTRVMTALLGSIAGVSLLVGGIGIMNIMLVSVTERTREIGTRLAVGARSRDIMLQFLVEAGMLSGLGGLIGIGLGAGAAEMISRVAGWPMLLSPAAMIFAFVFSGIIGVFFGLYPARKASRLDPIEALRYD